MPATARHAQPPLVARQTGRQVLAKRPWLSNREFPPQNSPLSKPNTAIVLEARVAPQSVLCAAGVIGRLMYVQLGNRSASEIRWFSLCPTFLWMGHYHIHAPLVALESISQFHRRARSAIGYVQQGTTVPLDLPLRYHALQEHTCRVWAQRQATAVFLARSGSINISQVRQAACRARLAATQKKFRAPHVKAAQLAATARILLPPRSRLHSRRVLRVPTTTTLASCP